MYLSIFSGLLSASIEAKKGGDKRPTFSISFKEHCFTTNYVKKEDLYAELFARLDSIGIKRSA